MSSSASSRSELRHVLNGGRGLAYAEFGDPDGAPVFFLHGWIGSRLDFQPNHKVASEIGARVIAVDRPGCGLSDPQDGRSILDWPDDIGQLADGLGIERFAVLGYSFGGPYAAACAYRLAGRLSGSAIVAGIAPIARKGATKGMPAAVRLNLLLASVMPLATKPFLSLMRSAVRNPDTIRKGALRGLTDSERQLLAKPEFDVLLNDLGEMFRQGIDGPYQDAVLVARDWGFRTGQIGAKVDLWYGDADTNVPLQMGEYYRDTIPDSQTHFYPGEGHFIFYTRAGEILSQLVHPG